MDKVEFLDIKLNTFNPIENTQALDGAALVCFDCFETELTGNTFDG